MPRNNQAMQRPTGPTIVRQEFYTYASNVASIASGANATDSINIEASSDFVLEKLTFFADIAAAAQTVSSQVLPLVKLQITDTGSGNQIFSTALPIPMIFGTGALPFILPRPRKFDANSTIQLAYTNYDAASTYQLYIGFVGRKVFYR